MVMYAYQPVICPRPESTTKQALRCIHNPILWPALTFRILLLQVQECALAPASS